MKSSTLKALVGRATPSAGSPYHKSPKSVKRKTFGRGFSEADSNSGDPTYAPLCDDVKRGPLAAHLQLPKWVNQEKVVDEVLRDFLKDNSRIAGDVGATIDMRLQDKVLMLDNPTTRAAAGRAFLRATKSRGKRSLAHMSSRKQRSLGSFSIPEQYCKYSLYKPLQEMWKEYVTALLAQCRGSMEMTQSLLLSADLHGAILAVVESKSKSVVGTQGIMIRETETAFSIITCEDKLRVIPKRGTIFMLQVEDLRVTLFGNSMSARSLKPAPDTNVQKVATIEL